MKALLESDFVLSHEVLLTFRAMPHLFTNVNTAWSGWTWVENLNICVSAVPQLHHLWKFKIIPASLQKQNFSVVTVTERFYFLSEISFVVRYFSSWRPLCYADTHDSKKQYFCANMMIAYSLCRFSGTVWSCFDLSAAILVWSLLVSMMKISSSDYRCLLSNWFFSSNINKLSITQLMNILLLIKDTDIVLMYN